MYTSINYLRRFVYKVHQIHRIHFLTKIRIVIHLGLLLRSLSLLLSVRLSRELHTVDVWNSLKQKVLIAMVANWNFQSGRIVIESPDEKPLMKTVFAIL